MAEEEISQDTVWKPYSKGHSLPGGGGGRDLSGHGKKELTERLSRTDDGRGTCQDKEGKRPSEGYSLSGKGR